VDLIGDEDLADSIIFRNPDRIWQRLREQRILRTSSGQVMVGRYDDCVRVLTDAATFGQPRYPGGANLASADPPLHTRLRKIIAPALSPKVIGAFRSQVRALSQALLEPVISAGEGDMVAFMAAPLPPRVIHALVGLTAAESKAWFDQRTDAVAVAFGAPGLTVGQVDHLGTLFAAAAESHASETAFFAKMIETRDPRGEDIVSLLLRAEAEGTLAQAEVVETLIVLLEGGENTTVNLLGTLVFLLCQHPEQLDAVRADQSLISPAINEALRFLPVNQIIRRRVRRDVELADERLQENDVVVCAVAAANRDDVIFAEPNTFDIHRPNAHRHLSFGTGIHLCIGHALARLEATEALDCLLDRLPGMRLSPEHPVRFNERLNDRGPQSLPLVWDQPT